MIAASVSDYRELARARLPSFLFEYIDGDSYSEVTPRQNVTDLESVALHQRVLRDVSDLDTSTTLFGQRLSMPVILAPIGLAGMNARHGEVQAVDAANRAGIPLCLSTVSVCSLAEAARVLKGKSALEDFFAWMRANFDPTVTWSDIEWLRVHWKCPLILKGILDARDAHEAVRLGVDGIVVSNHGGRPLDGVLSSARALPAIADAVGAQVTILADGGVRSGLDAGSTSFVCSP